MDHVLLLINENELVSSDIKHINQLSYWDTNQTKSVDDTKQPSHSYMALPLNIAIFNGHLDIVNMLLEYGADPLLKDGLGRNALVACIYGYDVFQLNATTIESISQQHDSHLEILSILLEYLHRFDKIDLLNLPCSELNGITLLCFTSYLNKHLFVQLLLKYVDVNACDISGSTPLMYAVRDQQINVIKLLIQHNANPYKKNKQGLDAFSYSNATTKALLKQDTIDISKELRLILDGPTSPTATVSSLPSPSRVTSIDLSSLNFHSFESIQSLCSSNPSLLSAIDNHHNSLLHYAAKIPNYQILEFLLPQMNPNLLNIHNKSPLHYLIKKHKSESVLLPCLLLFLKHGCDVAVHDKYGSTAYDYAVKYNYTQLLPYLQPFQTNRKSSKRVSHNLDISTEFNDILHKYDKTESSTTHRDIPKGNLAPAVTNKDRNRKPPLKTIQEHQDAQEHQVDYQEHLQVQQLTQLSTALCAMVSTLIKEVDDNITPPLLETPEIVQIPVQVPVVVDNLIYVESQTPEDTTDHIQFQQFLVKHCNALQQPTTNIYKQKWEQMINHVESLMGYLEEMQLIQSSSSGGVQDDRVQLHLEWYQSKLQETNASIYQIDLLLVKIHEEKQMLYTQLQQLIKQKRASAVVNVSEEYYQIQTKKESLEMDLHGLTVEKMILYMDRCKEILKLRELEQCGQFDHMIAIIKQMVKNVTSGPANYVRLDLNGEFNYSEEELVHKIVEMEIHYELLTNLHKNKILNLENQYSDLLYDGQQKDEVIRQQDKSIMELKKRIKDMDSMKRTVSTKSTNNPASGILHRINSTLHKRSTTEMTKTTFSTESDLSISDVDEIIYPNALASLSRNKLPTTKRAQVDEKYEEVYDKEENRPKLFKRMNKSLTNLRLKFNK